MPKLIAWFVDNPVAANLLMFILIASGLLALQDVRKEEFPNVEAPVVTVMVPYLGAAPAEKRVFAHASKSRLTALKISSR